MQEARTWAGWRKLARYRLEYVGLRTVGLVMRLLPMEAASAFMGWCWRMLAPRLHRHARAIEHLAFAYPEKSPAEREGIALDMWTNLGRAFAENFFIDRIVSTGRVDDRDATALLAVLKAQARGVVFAGLHSGNWELGISPTLPAGMKVAGIYQRVKNHHVDLYLASQRRERYPRGLFPKSADNARKLIRIVREGGAVAVLADLRDRGGIPAPFFGRPAPTSGFPGLLARSGDTALVLARVVRLGGVRFRIEAEVMEVPRTADREADVVDVTLRMQARFEEWIREYPGQWMWAHKRWN